jgi:hypothetical protein
MMPYYRIIDGSIESTLWLLDESPTHEVDFEMKKPGIHEQVIATLQTNCLEFESQFAIIKNFGQFSARVNKVNLSFNTFIRQIQNSILVPNGQSNNIQLAFAADKRSEQDSDIGSSLEQVKDKFEAQMKMSTSQKTQRHHNSAKFGFIICIFRVSRLDELMQFATIMNFCNQIQDQSLLQRNIPRSELEDYMGSNIQAPCTARKCSHKEKICLLSYLANLNKYCTDDNYKRQFNCQVCERQIFWNQLIVDIPAYHKLINYMDKLGDKPFITGDRVPDDAQLFTDKDELSNSSRKSSVDSIQVFIDNDKGKASKSQKAFQSDIKNQAKSPIDGTTYNLSEKQDKEFKNEPKITSLISVPNQKMKKSLDEKLQQFVEKNKKGTNEKSNDQQAPELRSNSNSIKALKTGQPANSKANEKFTEKMKKSTDSKIDKSQSQKMTEKANGTKSKKSDSRKVDKEKPTAKEMNFEGLQRVLDEEEMRPIKRKNREMVNQSVSENSMDTDQSFNLHKTKAIPVEYEAVTCQPKQNVTQNSWKYSSIKIEHPEHQHATPNHHVQQNNFTKPPEQCQQNLYQQSISNQSSTTLSSKLQNHQTKQTFNGNVRGMPNLPIPQANNVKTDGQSSLRNLPQINKPVLHIQNAKYTPPAEIGSAISRESNFPLGQKQKASNLQELQPNIKKVKGLTPAPQTSTSYQQPPQSFGQIMTAINQARQETVSYTIQTGVDFLNEQKAKESRKEKPTFLSSKFFDTLQALFQNDEAYSRLTLIEQSLIEAYYQFRNHEDGLMMFRKFGYTNYYKNSTNSLREIVFEQMHRIMKFLVNDMPIPLKVNIFNEVLLGIILKHCGIEMKDPAQFAMSHLLPPNQISRSFLKQLFQVFKELLVKNDPQCVPVFWGDGVKAILRSLNFNSHSKLREFGVEE